MYDPFAFSNASIEEMARQYKYFRVLDARSVKRPHYVSTRYVIAGYRNWLCYLFGIWHEVAPFEDPEQAWSLCALLNHFNDMKKLDDLVKEVGISEKT